MADLFGTDRCQLLPLPEATDDYVELDNPVRFIEAFGDGLDLHAAGFVRVHAKTMGRPGYDPADLSSSTSTVISTGFARADAWKPKHSATSR